MTHPLGDPPSKIIAVHLNYPSRAKERGRIPAQPSYFLKPPRRWRAPRRPSSARRGVNFSGSKARLPWSSAAGPSGCGRRTAGPACGG